MNPTKEDKHLVLDKFLLIQEYMKDIESKFSQYNHSTFMMQTSITQLEKRVQTFIQRGGD